MHAMTFGALLTALGVVLYLVSVLRHMDDAAGNPWTRFLTALIPAAFGIVLIVLGAIARRGERARMHAMHAAAMVGLLGAIAAGVMLARRLSQGQEWNLALTGMALLGLLCAVFVVLCVNSFIAARRARKQREGS
jgi:hypothetical protein